MKPRRKHPGLNSAVLSPQGRLMLTLINDRLGPVEYQAIDERRGGGHVFLFVGDLGVGLLAETSEVAADGTIIHRWRFLHRAPDDLAFELSLVAHRFDPWAHAEATGDRSVVDLPTGRRRAETTRRSEAAGERYDVLTCSRYGPGAEPTELLSFSVARLDALACERLAAGRVTEGAAAS